MNTCGCTRGPRSSPIETLSNYRVEKITLKLAICFLLHQVRSMSCVHLNQFWLLEVTQLDSTCHIHLHFNNLSPVGSPGNQYWKNMMRAAGTLLTGFAVGATSLYGYFMYKGDSSIFCHLLKGIAVQAIDHLFRFRRCELVGRTRILFVEQVFVS